MCSNDSPSVKPDGTTDAAELAAAYEEFLLDIEEQPLPEYRTDEMRVRIEEVRATLATEGVASAGQLQQLLRTVTEALADVQAAQVVPVPEDRNLSAAVPGATGVGAAYEVTETEQATATNVLLDLLFTVVETPTREDRHWADGERRQPGDDQRQRDDDSEASAADDANDANDADDSGTNSFAVEGYAGPE